jgi:hypothetical protein
MPWQPTLFATACSLPSNTYGAMSLVVLGSLVQAVWGWDESSCRAMICVLRGSFRSRPGVLAESIHVTTLVILLNSAHSFWMQLHLYKVPCSFPFRTQCLYNFPSQCFRSLGGSQPTFLFSTLLHKSLVLRDIKYVAEVEQTDGQARRQRFVVPSQQSDT